MSFRARQPPRPSGLTLPGIPALAGAARPEIPERETPPWQSPPDWWPPGSSVNEWAVYWVFTQHHHYREDYDFRRQVAVPAPGLFESRGFTRVDFLLPIGGDHPASADGDYDYVAIDPITTWTHPDRGLDLLKRQLLADNAHPWRCFLVWLDADVLDYPITLVDEAVRGHDHSMRSKGW